MRTTHEVVTSLLWISSMNLPSIGVEFREMVAMEAVIVSRIVEGSRAVGHALEFLMMYLLAVNVKVVDFMTWSIKEYM